MPVKQVIQGRATKVLVYTTDIDDASTEQLRNIAALPFIHGHVAAMPDVHLGKGATVGAVIPTRDAIIPAAVGVDLGCGMEAVCTGVSADHLPDDLHPLRLAIEQAVPHGRTDNGGPNDIGAWNDVPDEVAALWARFGADPRFTKMLERHPKVVTARTNTVSHLGTLGTGNHFIEVCIDERGLVWVMLHSGSRGVGNRIGTYFIELAKREMERWHIHLSDADLAYLPTGSNYFSDYVDAVHWAQDFAQANRSVMLRVVMAKVRSVLGVNDGPQETAISCHHNYVAMENHYGRNVWVTRKGAIRAREGDMGIIPGSMGTASFIVRGKGNPSSFCSCSHGAGRRMSRTEARRRYTAEDLAAQTEGVECPKDDARVDEIPAAYKPINEVIANQSDLAEVVHTLHAVLCVKG